ncbi:MAG TPA: tRNA (uridine(34)/cytosine(34)/5-carboxymethylaminomethyluridine(34)-2'-O)-methyltransferase TrmL [Gammaproteobacteria bacterium]|nr:tRNA (uridine(34)/cytosine(34)/5-carboxymethylaminomethyluridine(34)-2'-O)-methyltransferase TrmL [Gammaproteobacteria bacterium]
MPLHVVLYEPEIPPNTGNIIRLCANAGAHLHLIEPLGFELDDTRLRRAGLDYHEFAEVQVHRDLDIFRHTVQPARLFAISTRGRCSTHAVSYRDNDALLFGPESRGLPQAVRDELGEDHVLRIPMRSDQRSLNLSNAVAIVLYEAWRQLEFTGGG